MDTRAEVLEYLEEFEHYDNIDGVVLFDGLDKAFLGLHAHEGLPRAVYSIHRILGILIERDGMKPDEAQEFYDFNIGALFVGEQSPLLIETPE